MDPNTINQIQDQTLSGQYAQPEVSDKGKKLALALLLKGTSPSTVEAILSYAGFSAPKGRQLGVTASDQLAAQGGISNEIANVKSRIQGDMGSRFSPILGMLGNSDLGNTLRNTFDPEAAGFGSKLEILKQKIAKSLQNGVLSDQDIERITKAMPTFYDTPQSAVAKLNAIQDTIDSITGGQAQGYSNLGYDLGKYGTTTAQ